MLENVIVLIILLGSVAFIAIVYKIVSHIFDKTWENIEKAFDYTEETSNKEKNKKAASLK